MGGISVRARLRALARPIATAARAVWWVLRHGPPALARWLLARADRVLAIAWLGGLAAFIALTAYRGYATLSREALLARQKEAEREQVLAERKEQLSGLEFRDIDEMEEARDRKLADLGVFEIPEEDDALGECMMTPDQVTERMRAVAKIRAGEPLSADDRLALQPPDPATCVRAPRDDDGDASKTKGIAGWIARNRKHMNRPVSDAMTLELLQKELKGFSKDDGDSSVTVDESGNLVVVAAPAGKPGRASSPKPGRESGATGEPGRETDETDETGAPGREPGRETDETDGAVASRTPDDIDSAASARDDDDQRPGSDSEGGEDSPGETRGVRAVDTSGAPARVAPVRRDDDRAVVVGRVVPGLDTAVLGRAALGALVPAVLALAPDIDDAGTREQAADDAPGAASSGGRALLRAVAEDLVERAGPRDVVLVEADGDLHVLLPTNSFRPGRTATLEPSARWLVLDVGAVLAAHEGLVVRVIGDPVAKKGATAGVDVRRSRKRAEVVAVVLRDSGLAGRIDTEGREKADGAPDSDRIAIVVAAANAVDDAGAGEGDR